jgi:hypothetical protein
MNMCVKPKPGIRYPEVVGRVALVSPSCYGMSSFPLSHHLSHPIGQGSNADALYQAW